MNEPQVGLVALNPDHPGFRDPIYRRRRDQIAAAALAHRYPQPAPRIDYTEEERGVWALVLGRLARLHPERACREHNQAWPRLGFSPAAIAQLADVSAVLATTTGFRLQPVAGLVTPRVFMEHLADGEFLATQYMRHHSRPLYTPEPDVIHELIGHAALLTDERYAHVNRMFGEATRRADETRVQELIRVYWYGLEFGLVREGGQTRAIGAGLLSSIGELERCGSEDEGAPTLRRFSIAEVAQTPFDPTQYQGTLFVADSADALLGELERWLAI
jgi:phenylalanine-4-hydroxylase